MDELEINIDERSEVAFKISIEGTRERPSSVRFVCETQDFDYMFKATDGGEAEEIKVVVPPMVGKIEEGTYNGRLEVLIGGKYISPLQTKVRFKQSVKIMAEVARPQAPAEPEIRITARAVTLKERFAKKAK